MRATTPFLAGLDSAQGPWLARGRVPQCTRGARRGRVVRRNAIGLPASRGIAIESARQLRLRVAASARQLEPRRSNANPTPAGRTEGGPKRRILCYLGPMSPEARANTSEVVRATAPRDTDAWTVQRMVSHAGIAHGAVTYTPALTTHAGDLTDRGSVARSRARNRRCRLRVHSTIGPQAACVSRWRIRNAHIRFERLYR
jgi:hypothetical protein